MKSVWSDSTRLQPREKLRGDTKTDVLIIGGGMAGLLCAYFLQERGVDYLLVEADRIASGITKNTTAKITAQHGLIYSSLITHGGLHKAESYLSANLWAVNKFKELSNSHPCDLEEISTVVYTLDNPKKIEREAVALSRLKADATVIKDVPLPVRSKLAIRLEDQAQFNPMKFIAGISQGLNIFENTFVKEVKGNVALTDSGKIRADKIIVATHFPFINFPGFYFLKMYQHRSYVIALENAPKLDAAYVDEAQNGMSFRGYGDLLLLGGGDHRTGKQGGGWRELRGFARRHYYEAREAYAWATQDCITLDDVPYIGSYFKSSKNLLVATGFNKWGMTSSMVAAGILSDMVVGQRNEFADVFNPSRSILKPRLFVNVGEAVANLLSFGAKRCSHLGCALKWNRQEHTWDCPCHGSRFDNSGEVIDNPAMKSIRM